MIRIFGKSLRGLTKIDDKWLDKFVEKLFGIGDILKKAKIPNKFIIAKSLEEKGGK